MTATTIASIRATPVTVPLEAPLLHSNGAHWGRFVRTIVEVETADGYLGLGEMGGGGVCADAFFHRSGRRGGGAGDQVDPGVLTAAAKLAPPGQCDTLARGWRAAWSRDFHVCG